MGTSRNLLSKMERAWEQLRNDPEYHLRMAKKVEGALRKAGDIYSFWLDNPTLRDRIEAVNYIGDKKLLREEARRGIRRIHDAWHYLSYVHEEPLRETITPKTILELGRRVDPDRNSKGYRTCRVSLGFEGYVPPNPVKIEGLVQKTCDEIRNKELHPVEAAANAHLRIIGIQPFRDGNKRVARLIQNAILQDVNLPPIVVYPEEREAYLTLLEEGLIGLRDGNCSRARPFYNYIISKVEGTLKNILADLRTREQRKNNGYKKKK